MENSTNPDFYSFKRDNISDLLVAGKLLAIGRGFFGN